MGKLHVLFVAVTSALSTPPAPLREPPDPTVNAISIGSSSFTQQSLPLSYISEWPVWMASESGDAVSLLPTAGEEAEEAGWVNPATFEQLWQPQDLPRPAARAAIGAVLKDGVPRYIFPTIETTCTSGQMVWHNRGLNSLPLAKTWLTFGDVPVDDLRLTCYRQPLPEQEASDDESEDSSKEELISGAGDLEASSRNRFLAASGRLLETDGGEWEPILPLTEVGNAVDIIFNIIGEAPDAMGKGFCFLIAPLKDTPLPATALEADHRLRLFLSDVDATPTSLDPEDRKAWLWNRGECDLSLFTVAPGGASDFLPDVYRPLYGK